MEQFVLFVTGRYRGDSPANYPRWQFDPWVVLGSNLNCLHVVNCEFLVLACTGTKKWPAMQRRWPVGRPHVDGVAVRRRGRGVGAHHIERCEVDGHGRWCELHDPHGAVGRVVPVQSIGAIVCPGAHIHLDLRAADGHRCIETGGPAKHCLQHLAVGCDVEYLGGRPHPDESTGPLGVPEIPRKDFWARAETHFEWRSTYALHALVCTPQRFIVHVRSTVLVIR